MQSVLTSGWSDSSPASSSVRVTLVLVAGSIKVLSTGCNVDMQLYVTSSCAGSRTANPATPWKVEELS